MFSDPVWSPVSNKIAFSWIWEGYETYVVPLSDLHNRQYLGPSGQVSPQYISTYRPDWSPDGSQIAFECYDDPCYEDPSGNSDNPEIYKAKANVTGNPIRLTNDPATDTYPAFAPGGGKVVYSSNSDGDFDSTSPTRTEPASRSR